MLNFEWFSFHYNSKLNTQNSKHLLLTGVTINKLPSHFRHTFKPNVVWWTTIILPSQRQL